GFVFVTPLALLVMFGEMPFSHMLGLTFVCCFLMVTTIVNQVIASVLAMVTSGNIVYEVAKGLKNEDYVALAYLPAPVEYVAAFFILFFVGCFCWIILKLSPSFFAKTDSKITSEKAPFDPFIVKSKLTLFCRRFDLSCYFWILQKVGASLAKPSISLWNYRFHSTRALHYFLLCILIAGYIKDVSYFDILFGSFINIDEAARDIPYSVPSIAIILIAILGVYDSGTTGEFNQMIRFLWLRLRVNGKNTFIKKVYLVAGRKILFETLLSYSIFALIILSINQLEAYFVFFSIAFFIFKLGYFLFFSMLQNQKSSKLIAILTVSMNLVLAVTVMYLFYSAEAFSLVSLATLLIIILMVTLKRFYFQYRQMICS
ncbi:MAG: hypothetical protein OQK04_09720, partial [Kangiellaceae bacterium]|nr:hypothetical protein [Kangiellaceae bacterium]